MTARLPEIRAIVFDLDGTLVNSMPLVLLGYAHALAPYHAPLSEAEILARMGGPPDRFFRHLLSSPAAIDGALERLESYFQEHAEMLQPFEGARALLQALHGVPLRLGIWTGRDRASAERILADHGFAPWLSAAVYGDDLPTHKPDPEGLDTVLARLGVARSEALFVGYADVDVLAGASLGVRTLLVRHGRSVPPGVQSKAWRVTETTAEAYRALRVECGAL